MKKYTNKIAKNKAKIEVLLNENVKLMYLNKISRAKSFTTIEENVGTKKEPKIAIFKIMHYPEKFKDESTGKFITVTRHMRIERDGQPCNEWGELLPIYELETY